MKGRHLYFVSVGGCFSKNRVEEEFSKQKGSPLFAGGVGIMGREYNNVDKNMKTKSRTYLKYQTCHFT